MWSPDPINDHTPVEDTPSGHDDGPDAEPADLVLIGHGELRRITDLLATCEQFLRTAASSNVHAELSRFLAATRGYRCPRTASTVFSDILGFTTHRIRAQRHTQ